MWRSLFHRTWTWVRWLFGQRSKVSKIPPIVFQFTHFLVVLTIFVLLLVFSTQIVNESKVPGSSQFFQKTFCGWIFLLAYAFVRLLLYLISLFGIEESSEFTDIDEAWAAGTTALGRNGFDLKVLPVFLVLGLPEEQETNLFAAARMKWKVSRDRSHQGLVLGFYANDDAIYVSCSDVGALAEQLHKSPVSPATHHDTTPSVALDDPQHATLTAQTMSQVAAAASGQTLTSPLAMAGHTILPGAAGHTMLPGGGAERRSMPGPPPKLTHDELLLSRRRLEYLCRLVSRDRLPWCPINGTLMAIPLEWSKDRHMQELLQSARQDAETLHAELEMLFPVVCMYPGLEHLAGIAEFIERGDALDRRFKNSRAGSRYPLGRKLDDQSGEWVIERAFQWFRDWVYAEFKKDLSHKDNKRLYRLLCDLDDRRTRLVGQLKEVFGPLSSQVRVAGCYFCACGSDGGRRAFVHDVLRKAVDDQEHVAWSTEKVARDRTYRFWARCLGAAAVLLAVADVALVVLLSR